MEFDLPITLCPSTSVRRIGGNLCLVKRCWKTVGYLRGLGRKLQAFFGVVYLSGWLEKEAWFFLIPETIQ